MSANSMIAQMEKALGWGEPNPVHDWYGDRNGSYFSYGSTPWCDMTITWAAALSGNYSAVCMGTDYAYTVWHAQAFQKAGRWHYGTSGIRRGDILFFDWSGTNNIGAIDHVGIVTSVSGGAIRTIEGNIGNRCDRFTRYAGDIAGYGRPDYSQTDSGGSAAGEDEMPDNIWYTASGGQVINPGQWTTLELNRKTGGKDGTYWSVLFGECYYNLTGFVELDGTDLPEGSEMQVRISRYRQEGGIDLPGGILKKGDGGGSVKELQRALEKLGYKLPKYGPDGDFGSETQSALKRFQRDASILVDGEYGPKTKAAMEDEAGSARWVRYADHRLTSTAHVGGDCHAGYARAGHLGKGQRIRVRVCHYGPKPVRIKDAEITALVWGK